MLTRFFEIRSSVRATERGKGRSKQFADTQSPIDGPRRRPSGAHYLGSRSRALRGVGGEGCYTDADQDGAPDQLVCDRYYTSGERWRDIDADSSPFRARGWDSVGRGSVTSTATNDPSSPSPRSGPGPTHLQGSTSRWTGPPGPCRAPAAWMVRSSCSAFGNTPPGVVGPEQAKSIVMGEDAGDVAGFWVMAGPGDVSGDGLGDIANSTSPYGYSLHVNVLHPCEDFGARAP